MHTRHTVDIDAPPATVWEVMSDIERWPEWTPTVTAAELLDGGGLTAGAEARIQQPTFGTRVWRVTAIEPGSSFTWENRSTGALMVATHSVAPRGDGSTVTLEMRSSGWAVALVGWLLGGKGRRFIETEGAGLKARAEARAEAG